VESPSSWGPVQKLLVNHLSQTPEEMVKLLADAHLLPPGTDQQLLAQKFAAEIKSFHTMTNQGFCGLSLMSRLARLI